MRSASAAVLLFLLAQESASGFVTPRATYSCRSSSSSCRDITALESGKINKSIDEKETEISEGTTPPSISDKSISVFASLWGTGGVMLLLVEAFRRTLPSALEPIRSAAFSPLQWASYFSAVALFAYGQGFKCLQRKLAPLVVKRTSVLASGESQQRTLINTLLAPVYAIGLISASKSRLIKAHYLVWGTVSLQVALQRGWVLGNSGPVLNIVNAGFCAGFFWGIAALTWQALLLLKTGTAPLIDADLP